MPSGVCTVSTASLRRMLMMSPWLGHGLSVATTRSKSFRAATLQSSSNSHHQQHYYHHHQFLFICLNLPAVTQGYAGSPKQNLWGFPQPVFPGQMQFLLSRPHNCDKTKMRQKQKQDRRLLLSWRARQALPIWGDKNVPKRWGNPPDSKSGGIRLSLVIVDSHFIDCGTTQGRLSLPTADVLSTIVKRSMLTCRHTVKLQSVLPTL